MATHAYDGQVRNPYDATDKLQALVEQMALNAVPKPGDVIDGEFQVTRLLGSGAMARVFEVRRLDVDGMRLVGEPLALKLLDTDPTLPMHFRADAARRFQVEAMALGKLDHPNIVRHVDFGLTADNNIPYLVMELVEGRNLFEIIEDPGVQLSPRHVARLMRQLAGALAACHERGIVHRDVKPDNIIIQNLGAPNERLVLVDFGIARVRDRSAGGAKLTLQHQMMGTPRYMSPEHLDAASAGPAADLYSMGVVTYELLSGRAPFESESHLDVVMQHINEAPARLQLPEVPEAEREVWQRLVECMLRKTPDERPTDAQQVAAWLTPLAQDGDITSIKVRPRRFHTQRTLLMRARADEEGGLAGLEQASSEVGPNPVVPRKRLNSWRRLKAAVKGLFD